MNKNTKKRVDKITDSGNNNQIVKIKYEDKKGNITVRKVEPYKLEGSDFWGYDPEKSSIRRFKINRIKSVVSQKAKYEPRWDVQMNKVAFYKDTIEKIASSEKKHDPYKMTKMVGITNALGIPGDFMFDSIVEGIDIYKSRNKRKVGNSVIKAMQSPKAKKAFSNLIRKQKGAAIPMSVAISGAMTLPILLAEKKSEQERRKGSGYRVK